MELLDRAPTGSSVPVGPLHAGTRERVARALLEEGPTSAADLAARLGLTPAAVRRHLEVLVADGMAEPRDHPGPALRRGRGRPPRRFALTPRGRDAFPQAYDDLAVSALRFLARTAGPDAVAAFARARVAELSTRFQDAVAAAPPTRRVPALADALTGEGYAASTRAVPGGGGGEQLCQHHCPVAHVAAEFPQLCEAETEAFARLLGTHVQRLATIAHGDGVCTTYVPPAHRAARPGPTSPTSGRTA